MFEYAFIMIELLFSTVACKPKIGSWSWVGRLISVWRGVGVSDCFWVCWEREREKSLIMWSLYFHPPQDVQSPQGCRLLGCEWRVQCVLSEFFLLYASSLYNSNPHHPPVYPPCCFMFRCLCGKKNDTFYSNFDCLKKICFQHISVPFLFSLFL